MAEPEHLDFRPVTGSDYAMLADWLGRPHMLEWWGDPDEELGFIRDMVEGRDTTRPYLILRDGEPVGYIQVWFIGHHQNESWIADHPWLAALPPQTVGVDISIADPSHLSKGLGSAAVSAFVKRLKGEGHDEIIIDPDPANHRAIRAYEKAGFVPIPDIVDPTGHVLLMRYEPANEG